MLIDLFTGKEIPSDPEISVVQNIVKTIPLENREGVDFSNLENTDYEKVRLKNNLLTPIEIIENFAKVLKVIEQGGEISKDYCQFMKEQCEDWEVVDNFVTIE